MVKEREPIVNKYRIGSQVGEGSYSTVRKCVNVQTGEQFAVKIIPKTNLLENDKDNIKVEIQLLSKLNHPNIIKLIETFEDDENLYLVMELMPQDLLHYTMKHKKLSEEESRLAFMQIVDAVKHCHENGIAHRDLKLDNVILNNSLDVRLIDFGMYGRLNGKKFKHFCGSRAYAAPEILKQQPYDGTCVDVWSLGVILYSLLVGGFPFADDRQVLEGRVKFPRGSVSKPAMDLISRMLQRSTRHRLTIDEVLSHPWMTEVRRE